MRKKRKKKKGGIVNLVMSHLLVMKMKFQPSFPIQQSLKVSTNRLEKQTVSVRHPKHARSIIQQKPGLVRFRYYPLPPKHTYLKMSFSVRL